MPCPVPPRRMGPAIASSSGGRLDNRSPRGMPRRPQEAPQAHHFTEAQPPALAGSPPAASTKRTLEGSRGSCPPLWSPCSSPRSRSVRRGLRCGRSCPEAPPPRQSRLSPSPPSGRDPRSLRWSGDPSRSAPLEAPCRYSPSALLPRRQRFLGGFIVPRTGRERASQSPSAPADLEGGVVQPYAEEFVESLLCRRGDQLLGGGVDGHVWHPRLALTHLVASDTLAHASVEEVSDDPGPVLASQPDERPSVLERRVGVVHDHAAARGEGGTEEVLLPPVLVAVIREEILAHVLVGLSEPLAKEGALPRRLQAHEDDQLHERPPRRLPERVVELARALAPDVAHLLLADRAVGGSEYGANVGFL